MRSVAIGWSLVLVTILSTSSARATTLTVPDDVPTIQAALDATVDSVLVRPGMFPETPTIVRPVVLAALENSSQDLPTIAGVHVVTQRAGSMLLSRLRFSRSVDISNPVPNNRIEFRDCVADSAITSAQQIHYPAARLRSLRCTIHDLPDAYADSVEVDSCLIFGSSQKSV